MQTHIRKVYACLAVTCHLHFWQNDRDLLRATAVTRGWNGYRNKSQHTESRPWRRKFSRRSSRDSNPRPFNHESGALTTELSPPPNVSLCLYCTYYINIYWCIFTELFHDKNKMHNIFILWRFMDYSSEQLIVHVCVCVCVHSCIIYVCVQLDFHHKYTHQSYKCTSQTTQPQQTWKHTQRNTDLSLNTLPMYSHRKVSEHCHWHRYMPEEQTGQAHIKTNTENTMHPYSTNTETYNTGTDTCFMTTYLHTVSLEWRIYFSPKQMYKKILQLQLCVLEQLFSCKKSWNHPQMLDKHEHW